MNFEEEVQITKIDDLHDEGVLEVVQFNEEPVIQKTATDDEIQLLDFGSTSGGDSDSDGINELELNDEIFGKVDPNSL